MDTDHAPLIILTQTRFAKTYKQNDDLPNYLYNLSQEDKAKSNDIFTHELSSLTQQGKTIRLISLCPLQLNPLYKKPLLRKNKIISKKINSEIRVTMVHGEKDELVPVSFSRKVLSIFTNAKKKLVIIKNGDHSLSNKNPIRKIIKELNEIVINVV